jgi:hypothetical protein
MAVPNSLPHPRSNLTSAGIHDRVDGIVGADILVAAGDYTGGAAEDLFTLAAHGLISGDVVHVLYQSAMGGVTGGVGTRAVVKVLSSSTFQLTTNGSTIIENTADATVHFIKGDVPSSVIELVVLPNYIVVAWDFTGGTVEDMGTPAETGMAGLYEADTLKLLYKSAAGVTAGTVNTTYYCKAPTVSYFQIAATAGGAVIDSTADGAAAFLKTS